MTTIKNIAENLAIRKNCVTLYCQKAIVVIANTYKERFKACPCDTSAICGSSFLAKEGDAPFFSYILTNLFFAKCQKAKQVVRPRSIVRVPRLHVSTRVPSRPIGLYSHPTKSILQKLFAESNLLCIFVSANVLDKVHKTYPIRIIAGFLGLFQSLVQCVCQNTREPRSFCVHT